MEVDWTWIEQKYRAGLTPRAIEALYKQEHGEGPAHTTIFRRAQKHGWEQSKPVMAPPAPIVRVDPHTVTDAHIVQAYKELTIAEAHRSDLRNARAAVNGMKDAYESAVAALDGPPNMLIVIGGMDFLKKYVDALTKLVTVERQVHGLDLPGRENAEQVNKELNKDAIAVAYRDLGVSDELGEDALEGAIDTVHPIHLSGVSPSEIPLQDGGGDAPFDGGEVDQAIDLGFTTETW